MPEGSSPSKPTVPTPPRPPALPPRNIPVTMTNMSSMPSSDVSIRTMQDDLRAARGDAPAASAPSVPPRAFTGTTPGPVASTTSGPRKIPAPRPLPPRKGGTSTKVVMPPPLKRRHRTRALPWLLAFLLLVGLGGAGAAWWLGYLGGSREISGELAAAEEILPSNSALILHYNLGASGTRDRLQSVWQNEGGEASMTTLLSGDPRLLLGEAEITTFYYVLLENETRPYLVVPQTARSQALLEDSGAQITHTRGWYILHSVSTDAYMEALKEGALAQLGTDVFVATSPEPAALRIFLGPHALISMREALLGEEVANGLVQELSLAGQFGDTLPALYLTGRGNSLEPLSAAPEANQQILSAIPEEAEFIHVGGNFAADALAWSPKAGVIDMTALAQPAVASLMPQLQGSYGFFSVSPNPSVRDLVLIITLPPAVRGTASVPNPTFETALGALVPLVTGRKAVGPIDFSNNTHAGVPLRYSNFSEPSQALDYAVIDNYLVITTSRDSMFATLETITGTHASVAASTAWQKLLSAWGALPAAPHLILGSFGVPHFIQLFPTAPNSTPLYGLALTPGASGGSSSNVTASGVLVLPTP